MIPAAIVAFALALFMLQAMMEFTAALLTVPSRRRGKTSRDALIERLLVRINEDGRPYRLVRSESGDVEIEWEVVDAAWREQFSKAKLTATYRGRLLLDEDTHEARWYESLRTSSFFLGFHGSRPRFNWSFQWRGGYVNIVWSGLVYGIEPGFPPRIGDVRAFQIDTIEPKKEIRTIVTRAGWTFRPVLLGFQTTRRGNAILQRLVPWPLRDIPRRRFWGVAYPVSYALLIGYMGAGAPWTWNNMLVVLGISAAWWGIWGLCTWGLCGFPKFWNRKRSGSPTANESD